MFKPVLVQLSHPNGHVQTATSRLPCSDHPSPTATPQQPCSNRHIPMATFKPPHPNCHVQTAPVQLPQLPCSDHYVQPVTSRPPCTNCCHSLPRPSHNVPAGGPACLAPEVSINRGLDTSSCYAWDEHNPPPPHGHQVDIACSLPVSHSSQPWLSHPTERWGVYCRSARWHLLRGERKAIFLLLTSAGQFMACSDLHRRTEHHILCRSLWQRTKRVFPPLGTVK